MPEVSGNFLAFTSVKLRGLLHDKKTQNRSNVSKSVPCSCILSKYDLTRVHRGSEYSLTPDQPSLLQSCVRWQGYISAAPKEGIRLVEVMDVWARLCTISQINDWLMVWEISKLHRQATHFSCSFLLSLCPSSCGKPRVCWRKIRLVLEKQGLRQQNDERSRGRD